MKTVLWFDLAAVLRLAEHAHAAPEKVPSLTELVEGRACPGALAWVADSGVYLMSGGQPALLRDPEDPTSNVIVHAHAWSPGTDRPARAATDLGADDFVEHLHLTDGDPSLLAVLRDGVAAGHQSFVLDVTEHHVTYRLSTRSAPVVDAATDIAVTGDPAIRVAAMPVIRCAQCGATFSVADPCQVQCPRCGLHLVLDGTSGEWISPAELDHRQRAARTAQTIEASLLAVEAHLGEATALLPEGWRIDSGPVMDGSVHVLTIAVPADPSPAAMSTGAGSGRDAIAVASLIPRPDNGWHVEVFNRARRISYPLYTHGGAHAARYATVAAAMNAAINALRIELPDCSHDR
jgi:hypothetical protein